MSKINTDTIMIKIRVNPYKSVLFVCYTEAGKAIGFALEQPLHVVALPCSALRILKRLQHIYSY
ncbi:MAG: hypothetical protein LBK06_01795 [Planctomycetaceae bacterium]|nr:hypothetical protein [Planctomycetaceae bacterium]